MVRNKEKLELNNKVKIINLPKNPAKGGIPAQELNKTINNKLFSGEIFHKYTKSFK